MTALDEHRHDGAFDRFRNRFQAALFGSADDHVARLTWDRERIEAHQRQRLRVLLEVAIERSPFHARRLSGIDPSTFELADLARLPVMTKDEMMRQFDDVSTDRRLTLAVADGAIGATGTVPRPIAGELVVLASGGSSGKRAVFVFDAVSFAEYAATLTRPAMARRAAALPASAPVGPTVIVAAASAIHATGAGPALLSGSPLTFIRVPVTQPVDDIVAQLDELQPGVLYGYPSILTVLAAEQAAGRLHIAPASVIAHSESLRASSARIGDAFGAPVTNAYGASEGLVGSSSFDDPTMTFASDCCFVELVDDHDAPVPPGTTSAAVLVTNLFNTVQPLIRYRLDDRFTRRPDASGHGHLRADVDGRAATVFDYGHLSVHPHTITTRLTAHPDVVDFQVRQTDHGIAVDITTATTVDTSQLAVDLRAALRDVGLDRGDRRGPRRAGAQSGRSDGQATRPVRGVEPGADRPRAPSGRNRLNAHSMDAGTRTSRTSVEADHWATGVSPLTTSPPTSRLIGPGGEAVERRAEGPPTASRSRRRLVELLHRERRGVEVDVADDDLQPVAHRPRPAGRPARRPAATPGPGRRRRARTGGRRRA